MMDIDDNSILLKLHMSICKNLVFLHNLGYNFNNSNKLILMEST